MKQLKARLYEMELSKKEEEASAIAGEKKEIGWGSQIRSYVLHPYRWSRTIAPATRWGMPMPFLDGNLEGFIEAYLLSRK